MSIQKFIVAAAFAVLCACAPKTETAEGASAAPPVAQAAAGATASDNTDIAGCAARGGVVDTVGRLQRQVCRIPYADAGKTCRNKSDCAGLCILDHEEGDQLPNDAATGRCQRYATQFGCFSEVDGGQVKSTMCID